MAKRNMKQTSEKKKGLDTKYKYLSAYDLSFDEVCELLGICSENCFKAVTMAFDYGFVLGTRAREKKRVPVL